MLLSFLFDIPIFLPLLGAFLWWLSPDSVEEKVANSEYASVSQDSYPEGQGRRVSSNTASGKLLPSPMYVGDSAMQLAESGKIPALLPLVKKRRAALQQQAESYRIASSNGTAAPPRQAATPELQPTELQAVEPQPAQFGVQQIRFQTPRGILPLMVGIADTDTLHRYGLMYYRKWPAQMHGVLFIFPLSQVLPMWMKNTYLPLDMLFINAQGKVVKIVEQTTPLSETVISSDAPVNRVLEIPAGTAKLWKLAVGDVLLSQPTEPKS
jgi:uncharacterized membrane protein (UPF0127 family)